MPHKKLRIEYLLLIIYSIVTKFFVSINSIRYSEVFTDSDQAIFFSIGKSMLHGKVLYKDVFDQKTPYIYFFNAFAAIFEKNHVGLFILEIIILAIILIYLYKIVKLFVSNERALIGSLLLGVILCVPEISFGNSRTEMYAIAFLMPAIYLFVRYFLLEEKEKYNNLYMFIIGILASFILMTNIRAVVILVPFAIILLIKLIKEKQYRAIATLFFIGTFGVIITVVPYIIYAVMTDSVKDAVYAIFTTNINYAKSNVTTKESVLSLALAFIAQNKVFFVLIFLSFPIWFLLKFDFKLKISITISFVITFIYVVFSYKTNVYYLVILMPYILSIYFLLSRFFEKIRINTFIIIAIAAASLLANIYLNRSIDVRYINCYNRSNRINKVIEENFNNRDDVKILSYGFVPEVYVYTGTIINYKYFIIPNVSYKADPTAYDAQYNYILSNDPDVVVYANSAAGNNMPKGKFDRIRYTLSTSYVLADEFRTNDFTGTFYIFVKK